MPAPLPPPRVAILLSTFNGGAFLPAQLESFEAQAGAEWVLYWRDDGSGDDSVLVMEAFGSRTGRCVRVDRAGHLGVTASYMALLAAAVQAGEVVFAFSDQDDVWLPEKLARGMDALGEDGAPVLYCSRQVLVDEALRRLSESSPVQVKPGLGPALTQNIATGCTVMLNRAAAALVAGSVAPGPSLHDWWSYLVVAAAGGRIIADPAVTVLYRQHGGNAVGAPRSKRRRAMAALQRGPSAFMKVMRAHVEALQAQPGLMSASAAMTVGAVAGGLTGGFRQRWAVLRRERLLRQTWAETCLFRCWFLIG